MKLLSTALSAVAFVGCVSTTLEVSQNDPANPDAPGASPAETSRALAAGFDPFEGEAASGHEGHAGHGVAPPPDAGGAVWSCSMHPEIERSGPGKCPICGMRLIEKPRAGGEGGVGAKPKPAPDHTGHGGKP
ncbi:MAG: hypothetical protein HYZ29_33145 [Myxococcales bacterium]|jgi:hypothetical protein|nr:hypothetical protein [Myxococcales bacterium]